MYHLQHAVSRLSTLHGAKAAATYIPPFIKQKRTLIFWKSTVAAVSRSSSKRRFLHRLVGQASGYTKTPSAKRCVIRAAALVAFWCYWVMGVGLRLLREGRPSSSRKHAKSLLTALGALELGRQHQRSHGGAAHHGAFH